jgi:hypothetical protein
LHLTRVESIASAVERLRGDAILGENSLPSREPARDKTA